MVFLSCINVISIQCCVCVISPFVIILLACSRHVWYVSHSVSFANMAALVRLCSITSISNAAVFTVTTGSLSSVSLPICRFITIDHRLHTYSARSSRQQRLMEVLTLMSSEQQEQVKFRSKGTRVLFTLLVDRITDRLHVSEDNVSVFVLQIFHKVQVVAHPEAPDWLLLQEDLQLLGLGLLQYVRL